MTDFDSHPNWYAVQTKPSREEQAASNIRRLGLEVLLPQTRKQKTAFGQPRTTVKPLFPGYLFARFSPSPYLHSIRYARGVNRVLCSGDEPIPLEDEIISAIQSRIEEDGFVEIRPFRPGDRVMINDGPLEGLMGLFERELPDKERVILLLRTVEYQARIFVEKRCLAIAV